MNQEKISERLTPGHYFTLALFVSLYMLNAGDRMILSVLLQPVKMEFALSDTQLGLLTGLAFAICNCIAAVPLGVAADRVNRSILIAVCLGFWSAMTLVQSYATSFVQLVIARMGVGIGEAGAPPAAMSLISDRFPASRRATALSIAFLGAPLGSMCALAAGGWIAQHYGWRVALQACAVPGFFVSLLLLLFLKDPARRKSPSAAAPGENSSLSETVRLLWSQPALRHILFGLILAGFALSGEATWSASFFIRTHHLTLAQVGSSLALIGVVAGVGGTMVGGALTDRLSRRDPRWATGTIALASFCAAPLIVCYLLATDLVTAFCFFALYNFCANMWLGPSYSAAHSLVPAHMRGKMTAILYAVAGLFGYGLGSQGIGLLSDLLAPHMANPLRYSLLMLGLVWLGSAINFALAARTLVREREQLHQRFGSIGPAPIASVH
ncbi:spinster family MFS transporter [Sphingobium estronivorans]|uniref:spinster family MFS transporter n=1 Tax=Sphingobium estronivorans TaxID=1577690 RepID=UPI00123AFF38|nr:MFS transporter [Sphingobium estronivorans]